jgi:uncharacterized protein (TIGR02301 family)
VSLRTPLYGFLLLLLMAATPALADPPAPRAPDQRQTVIDLAYVLGESHALHRACAGPDDNTWRARMGRLLGIEAPDAAYKQRLTESFNAGFVAKRAEFPTCSVKSQAAARAAAARGRDLARRLAMGPL